MSSDNNTSTSSASSLGDFEKLSLSSDAPDTTPSPTSMSDKDQGPDHQDRAMAVHPFDNEKSRILFDAINKLQSWGSNQFLNIPQESLRIVTYLLN